MELREFIDELEKRKMVKHVRRKVNPKYEISTIMKMLEQETILFENVEAHSMPVVANLCPTRKHVAIGLGIREEDIIPKMIDAINKPIEPEIVDANYKTMEVDLTKIPILTYYPFDGGPYIASGIVIANDREYGLNASFHRAMVIDKDKLVLRILERDFDAYIKRGLKEFAFCIGNSIPVLLGSAISVPVNVNELAIANALAKTECTNLDGHIVPKAEIVMLCELTGEFHDEGPFLDLTETPDIVRKQRVARVKKIYIRENPVYHALLPGGLEHKVLMGMPREPTIYIEVGKVCDVKDVYITPGGCSWLHAIVSIRKKDADDGRKAIEAAFRGHHSVKHVFVVDEDIDIHNPHDVEWAMATRFQGKEDIIMKEEKGSSLDPSADPNTRMTTKIGFDLTIPFGHQGKGFRKPELPLKLNLEDYIED
ncbi:MAG: UbiD family decarboxylase [Thermoplasmata archaeon]|nr:UbiD family decarboxylase [Thermoplasmata archaeon]